MLQMLVAAAMGPRFYVDEPGAAASTAKAPKFCDKSWNEQGVCFYKFGDGTTLEFDTNKVNDETKLDLRCHGANQKVGDSFAGAKGNYGEAKASAQAVINQLYAGEWTAEREGGAPRLGELAEAISRIKGTDLEKTKAAVEKATDEQRKAWRSNTKVKAEIAKMRAEKAAKELEAAGPEALEITV